MTYIRVSTKIGSLLGKRVNDPFSAAKSTLAGRGYRQSFIAPCREKKIRSWLNWSVVEEFQTPIYFCYISTGSNRIKQKMGP